MYGPVTNNGAMALMAAGLVVLRRFHFFLATLAVLRTNKAIAAINRCLAVRATAPGNGSNSFLAVHFAVSIVYDTVVLADRV
jgi:hypothetical protein